MQTSGELQDRSSLMRLPAELRLRIYSYVIPHRRLDVDLCTEDRRTKWSFAVHKSSLVAQTLALEAIARQNGLNLLGVSRRTKMEVLCQLSKLTVRFHCPRCFETWLGNLTFGFGDGTQWMRHVEIIFTFGDSCLGPHEFTHALVKILVREAVEAAQRTTWLYYGRLDQTYQERWETRPLTEDDGFRWIPPPPDVELPSPPVPSDATSTQTAIRRQPSLPFEGMYLPLDRQYLPLDGQSYVPLDALPDLRSSPRESELPTMIWPSTAWLISGWFLI